MVYFDNTATSWPKPPEVLEVMTSFLKTKGANPGRSGHRLSIEAARVVYESREIIADLFNVTDPLRIVFGRNATEAINIALHGLLKPDDHVVTGAMEHNSVMRPLRSLEKNGVQVTVVPCSKTGFLSADDIEHAIKNNTKMLVFNHASNVVGSILPISKIGALARQKNLLLLVDAAQTAGCYPIDIRFDCIDLLAFTGHKSLYGPPGVGGLVIGERVDLSSMQTLTQGGTGSRSEREEQPDFLPDMLESGTLNSVGIAGLAAGVTWIKQRGIDYIRDKTQKLTTQLIDGLKTITSVKVYGGQDVSRQTATVSFIMDNLAPSDVGLRLDEEFNIMCRVGLHCAPIAHKTIGTFPTGTVRAGIGVFNTEEDVVALVNAVRVIAEDHR